VLIANGATVNLPHPKNGYTAIHIAAAAGYVEICRILRAAGAQPLLRTKKGFTALDLAATDEVRQVLTVTEILGAQKS